jgi:hypothetical protein
MATYTTNGGIKKIATGDESGTWGTSTNTNFDIIDRLAVGVGDITLSGTSHTLTTSDGSASDGQFHVLNLGGSPSGTNTITIAPNDAKRMYVVRNASGQTATFSQGSGANVSVLNGKTAMIFCDGAGSGAAVIDISSNFGALIASNNLSDLASAATALTNLGVTATAAELNRNDITTLGTVEASKVVTADANGDVLFPDNEKALFGASSDLQIFHSTADAASIIRDAGTGPLAIQATQLLIQNAAGSANLIKATESGAAELLHSNATKIATSATGVDITGVALTDGVTVDGPLDIEEVKEKVTAQTSTTGTINFDLTTQAIENYTANQTANRTINFRGDSGTTLNSIMAVGQSMTCTLVMKQGGSAYYLNAYQIDGSTITPEWQGGSAPTAGNASSLDVYTFTIIKTADATFTVLASQTQFA